MLRNKILILATIGGILALASCKKDETVTPESTNTTPTYTVPSTYSFTNMDYTESVQRLAMLVQIGNVLNSGKTFGVQVDAQKLQDMYVNTGGYFSDTITVGLPAGVDSLPLNGSGKQVKDKVTAAAQELFVSYFQDAATTTAAQDTATDGQAGIAITGTTYYFVNAKGQEYNQLLQKTMMGTLCLNQIKVGVNSSATTTADLEKAWDVAFGYAGLPYNYVPYVSPTPKPAAIRVIGSYINEMDKYLNNGTIIINTFIKGRAAISNKDLTTKNAQAVIVLAEVEKSLAAAAIKYMNTGKTETDQVKRLHGLSEGYGLIQALKFAGSGKASSADIDAALVKLDNLWTVTGTELTEIRDMLSAAYGLDAIKDAIK